jgi:phospholipase/carboxylesterase
MHQKNIVYAGSELGKAEKALIMLHGRGGSAVDILSIAPYLHIDGYAVVAPQASGNSWYPYSFLVRPSLNEPWLSSAIDLLKLVVADMGNNGITKENIYFTGFSQGACLSLEFIARNPARYGGLAAFSGGLIGDKITKDDYAGDLDRMAVFLGSGDPDPHIPVERVIASSEIFKKMNADITLKIYTGLGHTISKEEIDEANNVVFKP